MLAIFNSIAQNETCGTPEPDLSDSIVARNYGTNLSVVNVNDIQVLNIFFWAIYDNNGNPYIELTEEDCLATVARINKKYNEFNVFFKYKGFGIFNSPIDTNGDPYLFEDAVMSNIVSFAQSNNNQFYKEDSYNVYMPKGFVTSSGNPYSGIGYKNHNHLGVRIGIFHRNDILHELGHSFNLNHVYSGYNTSNCEHVTRNPNNGSYNANMAGDWVTDTAATSPLWNAGDIDTSDCTYSGGGSDCEGTPYEIFPDDAQNYMSYTPDECRAYFSPGQIVRMRAHIENDPYGNIQAAKTTIESLYHPYKGDYYFAGPPLNEEDMPHFQPGFDYHFVSCCCGYLEPSDYNDTSFSTNNNYESYSYDVDDLGPIIHQNHYAIIIDQIDSNQARRCQDNYNRTPIGGKVTRFNDGYFNYNITEDPKDSLGINSPTLINDLNPGLYKIEKNLNGGYLEEEVIQKNNNDE